MIKWNGRFNELVDERVELMERDKKEAQDKIRKQERSVSYFFSNITKIIIFHF